MPCSLARDCGQFKVRCGGRNRKENSDASGEIEAGYLRQDCKQLFILPFEARSDLRPDQPFQPWPIHDHQCRTAQMRELFFTELAQDARDGLARCADELSDFFVRQSNLDADTVFGRLTIGRPLQKQARQFFANRVRQSKRTNHLVRTLAILTEMLGSIQARISLMLQEAEEIIAPHEIKLAWLQRFSGQLVRLS